MMRKIFFVVMILLGGIFVISGNIKAKEYTIEGNGAGSNNSIEVKTSTTQEINQSNAADINNKSNSTANTGGNETDGGSIKTGDSNIVEQIINKLNLNQAQTDCCPTPNVTPKPTAGGGPAATATPKPAASGTPTIKAPTATTQPGQATNTPGAGQPSEQGGVGGPGGDGGDGGVGGGAKAEVLGLAAASGEFPWAQALQVLGLLCITIGGKKLATEIKRA